MPLTSHLLSARPPESAAAKAGSGTDTTLRALSQTERAEILGALHEERFVDTRYIVGGLGSGLHPVASRKYWRSDVVKPSTQRRSKPELLATGPNRIWSFDITKLLDPPEKWTYFHLYVIIDIYSRYVPGWLLVKRETAELAERLLGETIRKQSVVVDQLTIHADRGISMASKSVALLLADLGVTKSRSRPGNQSTFLSRKTVERHVTNILRNVGMRNLTQLAAAVGREIEGVPR